ncbi:CGNR zinc finger domain-containing protein [Frondihabitans australicus]|uniref:Putative RNA-binding Zn ribbon-like protein n=1 Tax=Frondihabitans australicus TaxID=386892 RepID=A0A495IHY2_9MICO|nr:CGNR zinc finger domain-containing protein [Frondihabitans australicus]RKR75587.1 putative RNA-binding Zn ribbon-like protein [Frondihabitans australicus]
MPTGQWFTSDSGLKWYFDAGAVSLDFAYRGGFPAGTFGPGAGVPGTSAPAAGSEADAPGWDGLLVPADLDDFLRERFDGLGAPAGDRELHDARALRDAIARLALNAADGHLPRPDDIDIVNLYAALPDVPPSLGGGRRQAGAGRLRVGQALASIARDAVRLFGEVGFVGDPGRRIRHCSAEDCGLVFADESRAGSRRWCSMTTCGNRAKVRAHRARGAATR